MKNFALFLLLSSWCFGAEFCAATYNVENLFDSIKQGTEYSEYVPDKYGWSEEEARVKLTNVARVVRELKADVVALQEVENDELMKRLKNELGYKYYAFYKNPKAAIGLGILSNFEIVQSQKFALTGYDKFRPILHAKIRVADELISVYANHFPSLKNPHRTRVAYANALAAYSKNGEKKQILLGDFNIIDYEGSPLDEAFGARVQDLWLELPKRQRWNYVYKGERNTLDRILITRALTESKGVRYKKGTFSVYRAKYLLNSKNAPRGNFQGYSDHLPLRACFEY
jgi:endonuclease/exonuclease/phosphatase family metal-dependent hydrolase